jgi:hypothetical protein
MALLAESTAVSSHHGQLSFSYTPANATVGRGVELGSCDELAGIKVPLAKGGCSGSRSDGRARRE